MKLTVLVGEGGPGVDCYRPRPFDLAMQPLRPGISHREFVLRPGRALVRRVEALAAHEGLPTPLWASLAIESQRALRALASVMRVDPAALERTLAEAANADAYATGLASHRGRRLNRYALALRNARPRGVVAIPATLRLAVPMHTFTAWELAAAAEGAALETWAKTYLSELPTGRGLWESAAAQAGATLAEWAAFQAARWPKS
jgi:hypothetical protein